MVPSWVRPSRPLKAHRTGHSCVICGELIQRHALDTDVTYSRRELCSRACERKSKGSQAERGRMRWVQEDLRP